jgi:hypothetical protein
MGPEAAGMGLGMRDSQVSSADLDVPALSCVQATYTFSLPYVYTVQTSGLSFPVHIWYDAPNKRLRTDVYGGLDSTLTVEVRSSRGAYTCCSLSCHLC